VSTSGDRWRAGKNYDDAAVIDLDGDGAEEIVALGERDGFAIDVWSWTSKGAHPVMAPVTREDPPLRPLDVRQSAQFTAGCRAGVATGHDALAIVIADFRADDAEFSFCRDRSAQMDTSDLDNDNDLTRSGCQAGIYRALKTHRRYDILRAADRMIDNCTDHIFGTQHRATAAKQ
jgi:hypothetical protein